MLDPFIDADWLRAHRDGVTLVDIRWYLDGRPGREAYAAGHIPGAVYVELDGTLAAPAGDGGNGRHPLPSPERFADGLAAVGIADTDTVVAYDDAGGVIAARLVWLLRVTGHDAALLDGGLSAWPASELQTGPAVSRPAAELTTGPAASRPGARFSPSPWPAERFASIDEVADTDAIVIDARDRARFAGDGEDPVDPRAGHIPGARNVPVREHLDSAARIGSPRELRERFARAGIDAGSEVISSCGSGVTACFNLLALERAGLGEHARLYPGSWSQWSRDPARAVETGPDPTAESA